MALTPVWISGFEYGLATISTNGGGLANTVSGTVSIQGTTKRTGNYALQCNGTSATAYIARTLTSAQYSVGSFYANVGSLSTGGTIWYLTTAGEIIYLYFNTSGQLYWYASGGATGGTSTTTITAGTWFRIDYRYNGTAKTVDWQINGTAETQFSGWTTGGNCTAVRCYALSGTGNVYFDDVILSSTSGEYPIGAHEVIGLSPASDGTHVGSANQIEFQDGTDITPSTTTAYTAVNSVPIGSITTYIRQAASATAYAELKLSTSQTSIIGAGALLAYQAASTLADTGACYLIDEDTTTTTLWGNPTTRADYSETSLFYKYVSMPTPSGGWDAAAVNAIKWRCGNSNDVSPIPYWVDLRLELAYSTGGTEYTETGTAASTLTGSGADILELVDAGTATSTFVASGADEFTGTVIETGMATSTFVASGVDLLERAETGTGATTFTSSGVSVFESVNTGTATSTFVGTGADVIERIDAGTASSTFNASGSDALESSWSGTATTTFVATGADEFIGTIIEAGTATSTFVASGADEFSGTVIEAGTATTTFVATGADQFIGTVIETGIATTTFVATGADQFSGTVVETGTATMTLMGSGEDIAYWTEAGTSFETFVASGIDQLFIAYTDTGILVGFSADELVGAKVIDPLGGQLQAKELMGLANANLGESTTRRQTVGVVTRG